MSLAKYNGNCKECGAPIRKGRTDIRVRTGPRGRKTVCAGHVLYWQQLAAPHYTGEPCDALRDDQLVAGTWRGWSNALR